MERIKQYTWLIILIAIAISLLYPQAGLVLKPYLKPLLMALMFFSLLEIRLREVFEQAKKARTMLALLGIIHLVSPLLVLMVRPLLSDELFLGFILASSVSSGLSVIFLSKLFHGKPENALAISGISNIASPIIVPFVVGLFSRQVIRINLMDMVELIGLSVFLPLIIAKIIQRTSLYKPLLRHSSLVSIGVLFFLIFAIIAPVQPFIVEDITRSIYLSALIGIIILINFCLGWILGTSRAEKITFGISAGYKNFTLATVVALALFPPLAALPAALYTLMNNLLLAPLQFFVRTRRKR